MCGICGKVSWEHPPDRQLIKKMRDRLEHRGPDGRGLFIDGPVGLGHTRLAIIDISDAGNQPMSTESGDLTIVFNGEIYNHQLLRRELQKKGATFRSMTDTEVILEAYRHWGIKCLEHLNGMFAFALWDGRQQRLFVARDRLGIKPFFYHLAPDGGLIFGSEIKSVIQDPCVSRDLDGASLSHYLSVSYTPSTRSALKDVHKLEAGHYMVVERGKVTGPAQYWDLSSFFHDKVHRTAADGAAMLAELLEDAVKIRMMSDVPLGAFLSGGVDSSSIAAAMCRLSEPQNTSTFSMGFSEAGFSELPESIQVAEHLGVRHRDRLVTADMASELPRIAYFADEPFGDTSIIPMFYLSEFARQEVTVCLSGDGADELFAGYDTYIADRIHHQLSWVPGRLSGPVARAVDRHWPVSHGKVSFDYRLRQLLKGLSHTPTRAHYSWRNIFSDQDKGNLISPDAGREMLQADPYELFAAQQRKVNGCHYLDQAMYIDIQTWLVDDILTKVDRASMAHSLEVRVPFLDHRIVEFAASLPPSLKLKRGQRKYVLKRCQKSHLPRSVLKRRKSGFNAPVSQWLATTLDCFCSDLVGELQNGSSELGFLRADAVTALWEQHRRGERDNGLKLFNLIMLLLWYRSVKRS